jgi:signal transduction histidine kinase
VEMRHVEALQETIERLRVEVTRLRASRERLVVAADADRRKIERDLHDGLQQRLVALAVDVERARLLVDTDPAAATALLDELAHDTEQALDEAAKLAQRIYPPLLEQGGLVMALRAAALSAGVRMRIGVAAASRYPPEIAGAVYFCLLEVLECAGAGTQAEITMRDEESALSFEIVADRSGSSADEAITGLEGLRDRVEALGGQLTIWSERGDGIRVAGSFPLKR